MTITRTKSLATDCSNVLSTMGNGCRPVVAIAPSMSIPSSTTFRTDLAMATKRAATVLPTVREHSGSGAEGHWLYTPKFGDFDHFQPWRCTT